MSNEYTIFEDSDGKTVRLQPIDTIRQIAEVFDYAIAVDLVNDQYVIYFHTGGEPDGKLRISTYPTSLWRLHAHD